MISTILKIKQVFFALLLVIGISFTAHSQNRVNYESLITSSEQRQNVFVTNFALPGEGDDINFITAFRINYRFLPFKKVQDRDSDYEFFSNAAMRIELFKAKEKVRRNRDDVPIEGLESAALTSWRDTAYADTYEETQSNNIFLTGALETSLEPGLYNYILQLNRGNENRDESSRSRQVELTSFGEKEQSRPILVDEIHESDDETQLKLLNFGNDAFYGQDFYAFVHLPNYEPDQEYQLTFHRADISEDDTTREDQVFETEIADDDIYQDIKPRLITSKDEIALDLESADQGYAYALVKVPNSRYPNASYQLQITENGETITQQVIRSVWLEMPTSLLNLDVSINMLEFITDSETIDRINRGSDRERERKFREFWKEKDPTPDTEYNELMAEYYERIDYAYEHFSTRNTPGYESDRGQVYIKYGPPKDRERKFPTDGSPVEIWTYDDNRFVFEATSGFGDFELISQE